MSKFKTYAFALLIFSTSTASILLVAEKISELVVKKELEYWGIFENDPISGWRIKSNINENVTWYPNRPQVIATNTIGLRDSINPSEINKYENIVTIQGDSNVLGYGMKSNESMSYFLQKQLNENEKTSFSVINAGVSGYDLQNYIQQAATLSSNYKPKYAGLIFNMGNDFLGSLSSITYLIPRPYYDLGADGNLSIHPPPYRVQTQQFKLTFVPSLSQFQRQLDISMSKKKKRYILGEYVGNSYFLYLLYSRLSNQNFTNDWLNHLLGVSYFPTEEKHTETAFRLSSCFVFYNRFTNSGEFNSHADKLLESMFREYKKKFPPNTRLTIYLLPSSEYASNEKSFYEDIKNCGIQNGQNVVDLYHQRFRKILRKADIEYVDMLPEFRKYTNLFLENNEHLSAEGQALVAKIMFKNIGKIQSN